MSGGCEEDVRRNVMRRMNVSNGVLEGSGVECKEQEAMMSAVRL